MLSDDCLIIQGTIINGFDLFELKIKEGVKIGAIVFYWRNHPNETKYRVGLAQGSKIHVNNGMYLKEAVEEVGYIDGKIRKD